MKKISLLIIVSALFLSITSCTNDKEEVLYKEENKGGCDTANVTYSGTVTTIFKNNCYVCHSGNSPLGGIKLDAHNTTVIQVNNGRLLGSIKHQNGFQAMPQGAAKLTDCQIQQIQAWVNAGAPNN